MKDRQPGSLVRLRDREWVVLPSGDANLLMIKPLGGSEDEITAIFLPLEIGSDRPAEARFPEPTSEDLGNISTARLLYDSARLAFRNSAGPFRALAKLSFRPRAYQIVPLIMALRQQTVRLLIADDVGVGKTIEALLIAQEMLERGIIARFAVICLPHLCEQWQEEIRSKLGIEAVIIRSNTQAKLDRQIQGDESVYNYYPFQIISIDYIKSEVRKDVFISECPELVIVDEAHTCARPTGATVAQQQRYHLLNRIANKPNQHLVLLTATPHSGKAEEFQSLLGLLDSQYESLDIPKASPTERREFARHFVQRKRADISQWMGEKTPFPERDSLEWHYELSKKYSIFFNDILEFARKLVVQDAKSQRTKRVQYWTALALLRGVMSSPAAGVKMLTTRLERTPPGVDLVGEDGMDADGFAQDRIAGEAFEAFGTDPVNPVGDPEYGVETDNAPTQVVEMEEWSTTQRRQLKDFAERLESLATIEQDHKLMAALIVIEDWIANGFKPVIFCRYIETAKYLGKHLELELKRKFPALKSRVVTSEDPDDIRKQSIAEMAIDRQRLLIATDCLSEGINLQDHFSAVLHYDLPWNPNRLEQREGRVDRFGQTAPVVKSCLLYGSDNPIDAIVLDVLIRKVREIKRTTGINVPFPEDSQSIIDTITHALLLNPDRKINKSKDGQQILFDFTEFGEAAKAKATVTRKIDEAAEREKASRSIFAQNAIKAQEIEEDLRSVDEAIGDPNAVEGFVRAALTDLLGVQVIDEKNGYGIVTANLPPQLSDLLPSHRVAKVSFASPTPEGYIYLGRNHRFVEQLCGLVMANTLAREDKRAARAAVIRTDQVTTKTTIVLCRCRNVIKQSSGKREIVAEEMVLWGWRGTSDDRKFLDHREAKTLVTTARVTSDLSLETRSSSIKNELVILDSLKSQFDLVGEAQAKQLVESHERFSTLMEKARFQVVYPVLPMDVLGLYVLLPEEPA
jgi:superfamily II DNA or RNA helicase